MFFINLNVTQKYTKRNLYMIKYIKQNNLYFNINTKVRTFCSERSYKSSRVFVLFNA